MTLATTARISPKIRRGATGALAVLALAEVAVRSGLAGPGVLPPVSAVLARAAGLAGEGQWWRAVLVTLSIAGMGLALAIVLAVPLGLLLGTVRRLEAAALLPIELLRPIPSVALIFLALLLLGSDMRAEVAATAYAVLWPVLINTMYGARSVDPVLRDVGRVFGVGRLKAALRVVLPASGPFIATGIRFAASIALIVAVSAELLAGGGIGTFMITAQSGAGQETVLLAIPLWAGVVGLLVDVGFHWAERRLFRWHFALRQEAP